VVVDGDPIEDIGALVNEERIHLVFQGGDPVAGSVLESRL
jgi:hypothetical protein